MGVDEMAHMAKDIIDAGNYDLDYNNISSNRILSILYNECSKYKTNLGFLVWFCPIVNLFVSQIMIIHPMGYIL